MALTTILFLLRVLSASGLLLFLGIIVFFLWKEYQSTMGQIHSSRRTYGYLVPLQEVDGVYTVIGEKTPLFPLTSLGRNLTNSVKVDDSFASGEHAIVALRDGQWWLEDRHSKNGTMLNEIPITQPVVMTNGDIIGIGSHRFRLELER